MAAMGLPEDLLKHALYIHIPYCSFLCHYCDFAKTANYSDEHVQRYFAELTSQTARWQSSLAREVGEPVTWRSVFFGGGTPSLFSTEYVPLFEVIRGNLSDNCEITLEANPESVDGAKLKAWRDLGFNRLSLGVQTFDAVGLKVLTRQHSAEGARQAIGQAVQFFPKVNVDLIFGWPGQSPQQLLSDLESVVAEGVGHVSLYLLTLEGQTPLHLAAKRGIFAEQSDERLALLYDTARTFLEKKGFTHEEVSNWALPGQTCEHNWAYWTGAPYVGIGAGAHGYLPHGKIGLRYAYPRNDRVFSGQVLASAEAGSLQYGGASFQVIIDQERDSDAWLLEYVASSLRTERGVDINLVESVTGKRVVAPLQATAVAIIDSHLRLSQAEWLRESAWVHQVVDAFG